MKSLQTVQQIDLNISIEAKKLAREIRSLHEDIEAEKVQFHETGKRIITNVMLAGQKLTRVKSLLKHGQWLTWLAEHCKDISERTARNYMALANRQHVADLSKCTSLRQAYIEAGILDDSTPVNTVKPIPTKTEAVEAPHSPAPAPELVKEVPVEFVPPVTEVMRMEVPTWGNEYAERTVEQVEATTSTLHLASLQGCCDRLNVLASNVSDANQSEARRIIKAMLTKLPDWAL